MSKTLQRIREDAGKLPLEKRHTLVLAMESDLMKAEVLAADTDVGQAWDAEIASRVKKIKRGDARLVPHAEVEAEMDAFVATLAAET